MSAIQKKSTRALAPDALKERVGAGLLSFPVTYFHDDGSFNRPDYGVSVERAAGLGATALFAAGGTGEFFSLTQREYPEIVATAVEAARGSGVPILAGAGYGTRQAVEQARAAEEAGADGILLLPPYLMFSEQEGLYAHVKAVCDALSIGVIVYNRDNCILQPDTVARLAEACPNLIGFKDGHGDVELLLRVVQTLGDRLVYVGGMPTAEVYASAYKAIGVTTYSSAVYNFIPKYAVEFFDALISGNSKKTDDILNEFFFPYLRIRNRGKGYAVSIVKAGMRVLGYTPGPVRSPLVDLSAVELEMLADLLRAAFKGRPA